MIFTDFWASGHFDGAKNSKNTPGYERWGKNMIARVFRIIGPKKKFFFKNTFLKGCTPPNFPRKIRGGATFLKNFFGSEKSRTPVTPKITRNVQNTK